MWCYFPSSSSCQALTFHHQSKTDQQGLVPGKIIPACFHGSIDRSSRDPLAVISCWTWRRGKHNIATRNLRSETHCQSNWATETVVQNYLSSIFAPRFHFSIQPMTHPITRGHIFSTWSSCMISSEPKGAGESLKASSKGFWCLVHPTDGAWRCNITATLDVWQRSTLGTHISQGLRSRPWQQGRLQFGHSVAQFDPRSAWLTLIHFKQSQL